MSPRLILVFTILFSSLGLKLFAQQEEFDTVYHCNGGTLTYNITFQYSEIEDFQPSDIVLSFESNRYKLDIDSTMDFRITYTRRGILVYRNVHVIVTEDVNFSYHTDPDLDKLCPGSVFTIAAISNLEVDDQQWNTSWRALNATIVGSSIRDSCQVLFDREFVEIEFSASFGSCQIIDTLNYRLSALIPELSFSTDTTICANSSLPFSLFNADDFDSIRWTANHHNVGCDTCADIELAFVTGDTVTLITHQGSCRGEIPIAVSLESPIHVPAPDTACKGSIVLLSPTNPQNYQQIAWSNGRVMCLDDDCLQYTFSGFNDTILIVEALSNLGCLSSQLVPFTTKAELPAPNFDAAVYATCNGAPVQIGINNPGAYDSIRWEEDSLLSCSDCFDPIVDALGTRHYHFRLFLEDCYRDDSVLISQEIDLPVMIEQDLCRGDLVTIQIENPENYMRIIWEGISEFDTCAFLNCFERTVEVLQDTIIRVHLMTIGGCQFTQTYSYEIYKSNAYIDFHHEDSVFLIGTEVILALDGLHIDRLDKITWYLNGENRCTDQEECVLTVNEETNTIIVHGEFGDSCRSVFSDTITISGRFEDQETLYMPNVFTPDYDRNNLFRPVSRSQYEIVDFRIYDRWGKMVYQASDSQGWDGTTDGKSAPQGIYVYQLQVMDQRRQISSYSGEVTLYR